MAEIVQTGQVVNDRYRVVRKLGGGGMADVYLCEDLTLGRKVALKVLQTRYMGDEQFVERFRREAKAAAGFSHPNLVAIFDWGALDGTYYIVMEYVEGETLKELIRRRGRLSGNEAVTTALGLLAALSYAHTHGVVHRDIKSQNILIDQAGTVKVTDFGIAHAGDHGMTEAGSILGTAQYLAPEQARGERVDERSDLYSVGVVLFEMLTGQVPFKGDSAVTVALKHVNTMPPEPAELVPGLPYALNQIVMKALAKDPEQRYQNADEFSRDLNAAQTGAAVTAATFDLAAERTELMQAGPAGATQVMPAAGPPPRRRSRRALWITLILLAVIAAAAAALFLLMGGEKAQVPDVVGRSESQAKSILQDQGFKSTVKDTYSNDVDSGFVARQSPEGRSDATKGSTVTLWVSRGPETLPLPNFKGWTEDEVVAWLEDNDFTGERKSGGSEVPKGRVFKQDPAAGTSVDRGATVTYWVSSGRPQVAVPDLTGMSRVDAIAALNEVGLQLGAIDPQASDTYDADHIISQDPPADTKVAKGSTVDVVVSTGPASPSPTPTATASVANVFSMDRATAQQTLEDQGFVVDVKEMGSPGSQPGTVVKQNPEAGVLATVGSTVTIWVAK